MLVVNELVAGYQPGTPVIRGVSLKANEGSISALVGSNGAGKSTTLRTIAGLLKPWSGSVEMEGQSLAGCGPKAVFKSGIAMVPEGRHIFAGLNVAENLQMGAYTEKDRALVTERMDKMFTLFPILSERRKQLGSTLSGGEQQMLALARALMSDPRVLLLDEPSMGLAPVIVERLFQSFSDLRGQGLSILLVEQNADLALQLSDYTYVIELGSIVAQGPAAELRNSEKLVSAYLGL